MGVGVKILLKFMLIAIKWHRRIVRIKVGLHGDFSELPPRGIGGFGRLFAIEKRKEFRLISHTPDIAKIDSRSSTGSR